MEPPPRPSPSKNYTPPHLPLPARDVRPGTPESPSPMQQRGSISEQRRVPPSPRAQRQPSFSGAAFQELLNNPPVANRSGDEFAGRDWKTINVLQVVDPSEVHWAENSTSVEDATNVRVPVSANSRPY